MNAHRILLACGVAALLLGPARAFAGDDAANVDRIVSRSRAALGGDALERAGVVRIDAEVTAGGLPGTLRAYNEIGATRFAETYSNPPISGGDGYDGADVWNSDGSGLVWVDGGQIGRSQEIDQAFASNYALYAKNRGGAKVAWGGTKTAGGKTYDVLTIAPPGSAVPFELWFDTATHLPARSVQTAGPLTSTTTFADYRPVAGVMIAYSIRTEGSDGNASDVTVTQAAAGVPDGDAHLRKPASNVHDFSIGGGAAQTSVPIELVDNHVYLSVTLDGKGPYRFVFDTGGLNLIDPAVAKEIGAIGAGSMQGGGVGSQTESVSFARVSSLQVGDATVKDQLFFVAPTRAGFGTTAGQPIDGLIGFEVLARFVTTFDYGANRVVFRMPGAPPPAGAGVVPFVLDGKQPQFACAIDDVASQCTLDTGARDSITLLGPFIAAHPQIVPANVSAVGVNGFGFGGPALGKLGRIGALGIGNYTIPNVVADFTTQNQGAFAMPFVAANVGGGIWKRFSLTLDYNAQTMALLPNANFASPDVYERAGLFLINHGGAYVVLDARPGTPAALAGIVKGDTIVSIDGKPASSMSLREVRERFYGAPGTVLQVGIAAKDGTKRTVSLTLKDIV
jgi:hypothetical protein